MKGLDGAILGLVGVGAVLLLLALWLARGPRPERGEPDDAHPLVPAILGAISILGALVLEAAHALGMHAP